MSLRVICFHLKFSLKHACFNLQQNIMYFHMRALEMKISFQQFKMLMKNRNNVELK